MREHGTNNRSLINRQTWSQSDPLKTSSGTLLHHYVGYVELVSQVSKAKSLEFHWSFGSTGVPVEATRQGGDGRQAGPRFQHAIPADKAGWGNGVHRHISLKTPAMQNLRAIYAAIEPLSL